MHSTPANQAFMAAVSQQMMMCVNDNAVIYVTLRYMSGAPTRSSQMISNRRQSSLTTSGSSLHSHGSRNITCRWDWVWLIWSATLITADARLHCQIFLLICSLVYSVHTWRRLRKSIFSFVNSFLSPSSNSVLLYILRQLIILLMGFITTTQSIFAFLQSKMFWRCLPSVLRGVSCSNSLKVRLLNIAVTGVESWEWKVAYSILKGHRNTKWQRSASTSLFIRWRDARRY